MSRRLLIKSSNETELPSKIVFKVLEDTNFLQYNITGTNVTLKDKNGEILTSVSNGTLPNISIPNTSSEDVFTIEADKLTFCNFYYNTRLDKVLEITLSNRSTDATSCFNGCSNLTEVRNINVSVSSNLNNFFANCINLSLIDSFYIKPGVNASYLFLNTKITSIPILNAEEIGDASALFLGSTLSDISSLQNIDLKWTNMSAFVNGTPIKVLENLNFSNVTSLSLFSLDNIEIIRNISASSAINLSFSSSTNLKEVTNIFATKATNGYSLFYNCINLETISNISTGALTEIYNGFCNCSKLVEAPPLNLAPNTNGLSSLFEGCSSLINVDFYLDYIRSYNGSEKLICTSFFKNCTSLPIDLSQIEFNNIKDASMMFYNTSITSIDNITIPCAVIDYMFYNCSKLTSVNITFSSCLTANYVFSHCSLLETIVARVNSTTTLFSCGGFFGNCSNLISATFTCTTITDVVYVDGLFLNCNKLATVNIDFTNNPSIHAFQMFMNCSSLVNSPTINWSKVINAFRMFSDCSSLISIGDLNLSTCEDNSYMFFNCSALQSIGNLSLPISTSTNDLFNGCINLETVGNILIPLTTDGSNLFYGCAKLVTVGDLTFTNATSLNNLFNNCILITTVGTITAPNCTSFTGSFTNCKVLTSISLSLPKVSNYVLCFSGCTELVSVTIGNSDSSVTAINTASMFSDCSKLTTVNMDLTKVFNPRNMFLNCILLDYPINNINITKIGNADKMFSNTAIKSITNLTISVVDVYQPNLSQMFSDCKELTTVSGLTITSNSSTDLFGFFSGNSKLVNISNITLNGTFSLRFFLDGIAITKLDLSLLGLTDTSNCDYLINNCANLATVTKLETNGYAETLINSCNSLLTVDEIKINSTFSNGKSYVISGCDSLTTIDQITSNSNKEIGIRGGINLNTINKINIPNAPSITLEATNLTSVNEIVGNSLTYLNNFAMNTKLSSYPILNTSNVTNFYNAFYNTKITTYNDNYNLEKAEQLISMFSGCTELTSVVISDVFTANSVYASHMCLNCPNLTSVTITNASKLRDIKNMFSGSSNITDLVITGFTSGIEIPPLITDVAKLEAIIESAGTNAVPSEPYIRIGDTRLATISTTVKDNATAKGWILA